MIDEFALGSLSLFVFFFKLEIPFRQEKRKITCMDCDLPATSRAVADPNWSMGTGNKKDFVPAKIYPEPHVENPLMRFSKVTKGLENGGVYV